MKPSFVKMKKGSVNGRNIGRGILVYLIALALLCLGMLSGPSANAQAWDSWNGRDPRAKGGLVNDDTLSPEEKREKIRKFSFVRDAIRFRLNQSFFDMGTDSFEEILRSVGLLDIQTRTLRWAVPNVDPRTQKAIKDTSWLNYKYFRSNIKLRNGGILIKLDTEIVDGIIYKKSWNTNSWGGEVSEKCLIRMRGKIQMFIDAKVEDNRRVTISIPQMSNAGFQMQSRGCDQGMGQMFTEWAVGQFGPGRLQEGLQTAFDELFNAEEGAGSFAMADLAKELNAKGIFVNAKALTKLNDEGAKSNFKTELGFLGHFSNSNGNLNLKIHNPKNDYVDAMGFEWAIDSGFEARSKNVLGLTPVAPLKAAKIPFHGWGVAPMQKTGEAVDFDAAASISEAYVGSLFNALFNSGFFNWQVQDRAEKRAYSINPLNLKPLFAEKLPNGDTLTEANYQDARLEMNMLAPPTLGLQNDQTVVLTIPRFHLAYNANVKGIQDEVKLLSFESKFRLKAKLNFTADAKFRFDFSEQPVVDFAVLERDHVAPHVTDDQLYAALNAEVARILANVEVELPLLKGRALDVTYLGIDGSPEAGKYLSVYLKVSKIAQAPIPVRKPQQPASPKDKPKLPMK